MKAMKRDSIKCRKGLVLPVIAAIALCLALLGLGVLQLGFGGRLMATRTVADISARAAADAGLIRAIYEMNALFSSSLGWLSPVPPDVTDQSLENSNATYSYLIGPLLTYPGTGEPYRVITSIGKLGHQERTVYGVIGMRNLFDYGLIVTDKLVLKAGTLVDGYDSALGYPSPGEYSLKIGTNSIVPPPQGGIDLGTGSIVRGDVLVGQGGDPEYIIREGGGGAETGPRYSLPEPFLFEPIIAPTDFDATVTLVGNDVRIEAPIGYTQENPYTVIASSIDVGQSGRIIFVGSIEVVVTGDMSFGQAAELYVGDPTIPPDDPAWVPSSLVIYLAGDLFGRNAGGINNLSEIPSYFKLFGIGEPYQDWDIHNSRTFYGVYYAPNADIIIRADADVFGSVAGHTYDMRNSGYMHYDVRLAEESAYDIGFGIDRWWERSDFVAATAGP